MDDVRVASIGPLTRLDDFRGAVHAVFASSVYVAPMSGPLLVIHDSAHGHTPTSCLVDAARPIEWGLRTGDRAAGGLGRLRVGDVVFDARHARVWRPAPTVRTPWPSPRASLHALLCDAAGEALQRLALPCQRMVSAFADGLAFEVAAALAPLLGAGPGLTPSGDDAIVGLLAVVHGARAGAPVAGVVDLACAVVPSLLHRTTPISAHYLRLALDGHVGEHLTALVDECLRGAEIDDALVEHVRRTGATSGRDALVGVHAGLSLIARLCRKRVLAGVA